MCHLLIYWHYDGQLTCSSLSRSSSGNLTSDWRLVVMAACSSFRFSSRRFTNASRYITHAHDEHYAYVANWRLKTTWRTQQINQSMSRQKNVSSRVKIVNDKRWAHIGEVLARSNGCLRLIIRGGGLIHARCIDAVRQSETRAACCYCQGPLYVVTQTFLRREQAPDTTHKL